MGNTHLTAFAAVVNSGCGGDGLLLIGAYMRPLVVVVRPVKWSAIGSDMCCSSSARYRTLSEWWRMGVRTRELCAISCDVDTRFSTGGGRTSKTTTLTMHHLSVRRAATAGHMWGPPYE